MSRARRLHVRHIHVCLLVRLHAWRACRACGGCTKCTPHLPPASTMDHTLQTPELHKVFRRDVSRLKESLSRIETVSCDEPTRHRSFHVRYESAIRGQPMAMVFAITACRLVTVYTKRKRMKSKKDHAEQAVLPRPWRSCILGCQLLECFRFGHNGKLPLCSKLTVVLTTTTSAIY